MSFILKRTLSCVWQERDDDDKPTVPSTLMDEFEYNPFLRLSWVFMFTLSPVRFYSGSTLLNINNTICVIYVVFFKLTQHLEVFMKCLSWSIDADLRPSQSHSTPFSAGSCLFWHQSYRFVLPTEGVQNKQDTKLAVDNHFIYYYFRKLSVITSDNTCNLISFFKNTYNMSPLGFS